MVPIFKPYMPKGISTDLEKILYSGSLAYGRYGKEFERLLSAYLGVDYVLTVGTYNHALLVVLSTLGLVAGDEIIASPMSCLASNQPFAIKGLKIVWADIDPETGSISVEDVKKKVTKNTKAIFHNHYCGFLGPVNEINLLGKELNIPVIDDCIEAFGSELNGRKAGNLGTDITVFSFQTVRIPNTIDGGAITFSDRDQYEKAKRIRDYGIDRAYFRDSLNEISSSHDIVEEGYGALMNEINSFLGVEQIHIVDSLLAKQRKNSAHWNDFTFDIEGLKPLSILKSSSPNYWVYGILAEQKEFSLKRFRELGFYATSVHINNNIYSIFKDKKELKGVNKFMEHFIALPCGWWVEGDDISRLTWS